MEGERKGRGTKSQRGLGEGGSGTGEEPLARDGGLYLDICRGAPEFLVTLLLMGPVCLLSQGRFEEPVRPCSQHGKGL